MNCNDSGALSPTRRREVPLLHIFFAVSSETAFCCVAKPPRIRCFSATYFSETPKNQVVGQLPKTPFFGKFVSRLDWDSVLRFRGLIQLRTRKTEVNDCIGLIWSDRVNRVRSVGLFWWFEFSFPEDRASSSRSSFERRLISLIFAGRNRIIMIRRELPLTVIASPVEPVA